MRTIVFGATGVQGAAQVRGLLAAGHHPVPAIRNPAAAAGLADQPVETVQADFADHASLRAAVQGADWVFLNLPSTSFQSAAPLIVAAEVIAAAATEAGVKALVFNTSLPVAATKLGFASQDARWEMRQRIFAAGVPAISIQPVVFLDNLFNAWALPQILNEGRLHYPHAETLDVSWICHADIASLMIAAAERPHFAGRSFAVGGPDTVRGPVLARILSEAWGRDLRFESQSIPDFCASMARVFEGRASLEQQRLIDELGRIYTWYNTAPERPFYVDMAPVLRELPARLTPIAEWARRRPLPASA